MASYRPIANATAVSGTYRRSITLTSGRFAMLDDGLGSSLVPWRPVIEKTLGIRRIATGAGTVPYVGAGAGTTYSDKSCPKRRDLQRLHWGIESLRSQSAVLKEGVEAITYENRDRELPLIVVIEDDGAVRDALECLLRAAGYHTSAFASAEDFLRLGNSEKIDCLVLDVRLPGMSGIELQRKLAENHARIPIIFVSGEERRFKELSSLALRLGALAFLRKPLAPDDLLRALERCCSLHARR